MESTELYRYPPGMNGRRTAGRLSWTCELCAGFAFPECIRDLRRADAPGDRLHGGSCNAEELRSPTSSNAAASA